MKSASFSCRLHAQLQAAEAHAQDVERTVQGQLIAALDKLSAVNMEPPQAIVRSLADVQAFAESVKERCQCLEEQSATAHRCMIAHMTHACLLVTGRGQLLIGLYILISLYMLRTKPCCQEVPIVGLNMSCKNPMDWRF